jgi:DNA-binding winged helix-turn-helix (wHTH) protein
VATGELLKNGRRIPVERQPSLILALLLEHPGEVVGRDQLRSALSANGTFVDFDRGLNVAVKKLRDALGDSSDNRRFIETLFRRGYRFIAPVHPAEPAAGTISEVHATPRRMQPWARTGTVIATVIAAFMLWRGASSRSTDRNSWENQTGSAYRLRRFCRAPRYRSRH